jgi:hypothetical protein
MSAEQNWVEADSGHPVINQTSILPRADVIASI